MKYMLFAMLLVSSTLAHARDPFVPGQMNFLVDAQLNVKGMSASVMTFDKSEAEIVGNPITEAFPLSDSAKRTLERKFAEAREYRISTSAVHFFNPFAGHPHDPYLSAEQATKCFYESEITPLFNASEIVGFGVKVRRYTYYWPLELEEW